MSSEIQPVPKFVFEFDKYPSPKVKSVNLYRPFNNEVFLRQFIKNHLPELASPFTPDTPERGVISKTNSNILIDYSDQPFRCYTKEELNTWVTTPDEQVVFIHDLIIKRKDVLECIKVFHEDSSLFDTVSPEFSS